MGHDLCEKTAGLASRVNNLAVLESGPDSRTLLEEQDRLARLAMVAIVRDLNEEQASYQEAIGGLNEALAFIGNAEKKIADVSKAIELIAKAATLVDKAISMA